MSPPFSSLENPFAEPPKVPRSKNDGELIGKILGIDAQKAYEEIIGAHSSIESDPFNLSDPEEHELSPRERLEITYNLTEQYEKETQSLRDRGLLETNAEGVEFIRGIDGLEYPLPSLETIVTRLLEQKETLDIKAEQGFTKLILVPFATKLDRQIDSLGKFLISFKKKHPDFDLNEKEPVWNWDEYNGADSNGKLVYCVKEFSKDQAKHQGLTKKQIIEAQRTAADPLAGWRIELLQSDRKTRGIRGIPRAGEGRVDGKTHPRPEIEAGQSSDEYLASQLSGESGMTPEDWISAFIYHLQETGKPLDDYQNGEDSLAFLTGAWFKNSGVVPDAYWFADDRQVSLNMNVPWNSVSNYGSRSLVRV